MPSRCRIIPEITNAQVDSKFQVHTSVNWNDRNEKMIDQQGTTMKDLEINLDQPKNNIIIRTIINKGSNSSRANINVRLHQKTGITGNIISTVLELYLFYY
jgi:hypothetical protein